MAELTETSTEVSRIRLDQETLTRQAAARERDARHRSARNMSVLMSDGEDYGPEDFVYAATLGGDTSDAEASLNLLQMVQQLNAGSLVGIFDGESGMLHAVGASAPEPLVLHCQQSKSELYRELYGFAYDPDNRVFVAKIALSSSVCRRTGTSYGYKPTIFSPEATFVDLLAGAGENKKWKEDPYFYKPSNVKVGALAIIHTIASNDEIGEGMYAEYVEATINASRVEDLSEFDTRGEKGSTD